LWLAATAKIQFQTARPHVVFLPYDINANILPYDINASILPYDINANIPVVLRSWQRADYQTLPRCCFAFAGTGLHSLRLLWRHDMIQVV
jgi:hypothetical protein